MEMDNPWDQILRKVKDNEEQNPKMISNNKRV